MDVLLDGRQVEGIVFTGQADGVTALAGTTGTTDTVYIVFGIVGQVVVEDVGHIRNVQTTGSHVGSDQYVQGSLGEVFQDLHPLLLRHVTGQQTDAVTVILQPRMHVFTDMLGVGEDDGFFRPLFFHQGEQQQHLVFVGGVEQLLLNADAGHLLRLYLHMFRVVHVFVGQLLHPQGEGGGEQHAQTLGRGRHAAEQEADVLDEAQIEHAIRFIQHHDLNVAQIDHLGLEVVDDATRGADQDVDALLQHGQLLVVTFATVGEAEFQAGGCGNGVGIVVDLHCQFPGGRHYDGSGLVNQTGIAQRVGQQIVECRGQEGNGLAGPCLSLTGEVMTFYQQWQRQRLDGRAIVKSL